MATATHPWDRLETETPKAYRAFCVYRDMGLNRSIDKAAEALRGGVTGQRRGGVRAACRRLFYWSTNYGWNERSKAWDDHLDAARQEAQLREQGDIIRERLRERTAELVAKRTRASRLLKTVDSILSFPVVERTLSTADGPTIVKPINIREIGEAAKSFAIGERMLDQAHEQSIAMFQPEAEVLDPNAVAPTTDEQRAAEVRKLDRLTASLTPAALAGDRECVGLLLRVAERRSRLLGLDAMPIADEGNGFPPPPYIEVHLPFESNDEPQADIVPAMPHPPTPASSAEWDSTPSPDTTE